jgi:hypothetical protein
MWYIYSKFFHYLDSAGRYVVVWDKLESTPPDIFFQDCKKDGLFGPFLVLATRGQDNIIALPSASSIKLQANEVVQTDTM